MKKILVAEDSSALLNLVSRVLNQSGKFEVIGVKDGKSVLSKLEAEAIDLILMDIQMPKMNGLDCIQSIRALESEKAQVPVVAITGNALNMSDEEFKAKGFNGYLPKPIDFHKLVEEVQRLTA